MRKMCLSICLTILLSEIAFATMAISAPEMRGRPDNSVVLSWSGVTKSDTFDPKIYFVDYLPNEIKDLPSNSVPILVSLHGSHGAAEAALKDWYKYGKEEGFAVVSMQWWLGEESYLAPEEVYRNLDQHLRELKQKYPALAESKNMIVGFSRSATYMPVLALMDKQTGKNYFKEFMLNAGAWPSTNLPPFMRRHYNPIDKEAYQGKHFCAYYGDLDEFKSLPAKDGAVIKTEIENHGGTFDQFIILPDGKHNTFVHRPDLVKQVIQSWFNARKKD